MNVLTFLTLELLLCVIVIVNTTERSFTSDQKQQSRQKNNYVITLLANAVKVINVTKTAATRVRKMLFIIRLTNISCSTLLLVHSVSV